MTHHEYHRRSFLGQMGAATAAGLLAGLGPSARAAENGKLHVTSNVYPWMTFYRRDSRDFNADLDASLGEVAKAGVDGFEPIANNPGDIDRLGPLLTKHKLAMRSLYVNSSLHDENAPQSIEQVLAIAQKAKGVGTRIIVTNPNPIRWGGTESKDDAMLRRQAAALNTLGEKLSDIGVTLAYHFHDIELRHAARELHHMLCGTDPKKVTLCLDAHWVFRGAGDSSVALFDIVQLYGPRISEVHLRQSAGGVWTEAFGPGDIDYPALAKRLAELGLKPHIVLEQAVEAKSPQTLDAVAAHRRGVDYARQVFGAVGA